MSLSVKNTLGGGKPEGMYVWKKLSAQGGDFLGYVVSDKETAYPDGGEKGGYWYEKVVEGLDLSVIGCTKMAIDTFTPASNIDIGDDTYKLAHSLGKIPKYAILISKGITEKTSSTDYITRMIWMYIGTSGYYQTHSYEYLGSTGKAYLGTSSNSRNTNSSKSEIVIGASNYSKYLKAGATYTLVTLA